MDPTQIVVNAASQGTWMLVLVHDQLNCAEFYEKCDFLFVLYSDPNIQQPAELQLKGFEQKNFVCCRPVLCGRLCMRSLTIHYALM